MGVLGVNLPRPWDPKQNSSLVPTGDPDKNFTPRRPECIVGVLVMHEGRRRRAKNPPSVSQTEQKENKEKREKRGTAGDRSAPEPYWA